MSSTKAFIFDLDGTLLNSLSVWDNIGAEFLLTQGITPPDNIKSVLINLSLSEAAVYFINELGVNLTVTEIIDSIKKIIEDQYLYHLDLKPFADIFLKTAKEKNIKMAIATSSDHELACQALKRLGILNYFQFVLTCEKIGYSKSYPQIYLSAAESLSQEPSEIIVFEDALYCIKTAKSAGFQVAAIFDPHWQSDITEIKSYADYFFPTFKEANQFIF